MHLLKSKTTAKRLALSTLAMIGFASAHAHAVDAVTWTAGGATDNFSDALNWDAVITGDCDLIFPANAYVSGQFPFNDMVGLEINSIKLYEAYTIRGNALSLKIISHTVIADARIELPLSTVLNAALTITVDSADSTLFLTGRVSGGGPVNYAGPGTKRLQGTVNNTQSGLVTVSDGILELASTAAESVGGELYINSGAIVTLLTAPQIKDTVKVTVAGHLDISGAVGSDEGSDTETISGLAGNGTINLGAKQLGSRGQPAATNYAGGFVGTGSFRQAVSGLQILSATSAHTGTTQLDGGSLRIWGTHATTPIVVSSGLLVLANDALLADVTLSGNDSALTFYESITAMNLHATTDDLVIGAGSTFHVVLRGPAPTLYSNVTTATADINGAVLVLDTSAHSPTVGTTLTIIASGSPIVGTFAGLAEGATVISATNSANTYIISYASNNVTLTANAPGVNLDAPAITSVVVDPIGNHTATIAWTTDELSDSQVEYGIDATYGELTTLDTTRELGHSVALSGLEAGTRYHYRVRSRDADGNLGYGAGPAIGDQPAGTFDTTGTPGSGTGGGSGGGKSNGGGCGGGSSFAFLALGLMLTARLTRRGKQG